MARTLYTPELAALTTVLRQLRQSRGLTQAQLAERLNRPQSYVSKYEAGQRRLDLVELRDIGQCLETSLAALVKSFEKQLLAVQGTPEMSPSQPQA